MKKKHKLVIAGIMIIIIIVLFVMRVQAVNNSYPSVTEYKYEMGESFDWQDFNVNVKGYQILTPEEVKKRWTNCDTSYISDSDVIIAEVDVNYIGNEASGKFPLVKLKGQAGAWYNSSELSCLREFNNGNVTCNKNEQRTLYTAICISHKQLTDSQIREIKSNKIQLVFQTYADVVYVNLK